MIPTTLAYIDPSSGSLAMQVLLATVCGAGIALRQYLLGPFVWAFRRLRGGGGEDDVAG